jgi:hypothetical protein
LIRRSLIGRRWRGCLRRIAMTGFEQAWISLWFRIEWVRSRKCASEFLLRQLCLTAPEKGHLPLVTLR